MKNLEALVAREVANQPRVVHIVFDDEQDIFADLQVIAVVFNALWQVLGCTGA
jgi:hypothetical protein